MKKAGIVILTLIIVGCSSYNAYLTYQSYELANSPKYGVVVAYNKAYLERYGYLLEAYKSVLTEEGVPWEAVEISALAGTSARKLAKMVKMLWHEFSIRHEDNAEKFPVEQRIIYELTRQKMLKQKLR